MVYRPSLIWVIIFIITFNNI